MNIKTRLESNSEMKTNSKKQGTLFFYAAGSTRLSISDLDAVEE
jgi:hypothetical protein